MNSTNKCMDRMVALIFAGQFDSVKVACDSDDFYKSVQANGWEMLTYFCEKFDDQTSITPDNKQAIAYVLDSIVNKSKPKLVVFALLESCEAFHCDSLFSLLVPLLRDVILSFTPEKRSLDVAIGALSSHIRSLIWADESYSLIESEKEAKIVVKNRSAITNIVESVHAFSMFTEPFIAATKETRDDNSKIMIRDSFLQLLDYPLLYFHLQKDDILLQQCCKSVVDRILALCPTITMLLEEQPSILNLEEAHDPYMMLDDPVSTSLDRCGNGANSVGLAHLIYLINVQHLNVSSIPQVISPQYRLELFLPYVFQLWRHAANHSAAYKGTQLFADILERIDHGSLPSDLLHTASIKNVFSFLFWFMQYCSLWTLRKLCATLVPKLLSKLDSHGRYQTFCWVLSKQQSPELTGFFYTLIKDEIHRNWDFIQQDTRTEQRFISLLSKIFKVPEEENGGNIIQDADKISAALNLAIYLVGRDKQKTSPFMKHMKEYMTQYIEPIGICFKEHEKNLQAHVEEIKSGSYVPMDGTVAVSGEELHATTEMELEGTIASLGKLQLLQYIHDRLKELIAD